MKKRTLSVKQALRTRATSTDTTMNAKCQITDDEHGNAALKRSAVIRQRSLYTSTIHEHVTRTTDTDIRGTNRGPFTVSYGSVGGACRVIERKLKRKLFTLALSFTMRSRGMPIIVFVNERSHLIQVRGKLDIEPCPEYLIPHGWPATVYVRGLNDIDGLLLSSEAFPMHVERIELLAFSHGLPPWCGFGSASSGVFLFPVLGRQAFESAARSVLVGKTYFINRAYSMPKSLYP